MSKEKNTLPAVAFAKLTAAIGTPGGGKSYNICGQIAVPVLERNGQLIVFDPTGAWFGLSLKPCGKKPSGYNIAIFGGDHGSMPLTPNMGRAMGELLGREPISAVLDMSLMEPDEQIHFVSEFAKIFLVANKKPVHVIIDEADEFMPQSPHLKGESAICRGRLKRFVTRGRKRGVRPVILTQRPQEIDKGVLNHSQVLIAFQCIGEHERKSINGYVGANGSADAVKDMLKELSELDVGEAWVWAPRKPKFLARMKFDKIPVYDSFKEEDEAGGFKGAVPLNAAKLDGLKKALADHVEEQKANDPAHLKAEINKLKIELAKKLPPAAPTVDVAAVRKSGFDEGVNAIHTLNHRAAKAMEQCLISARSSTVMDLPAALDKVERAIKGFLDEPPATLPARAPFVAPKPPLEKPAKASAPPVIRQPQPPVDGEYNVQERKILKALSELSQMQISAPRVEQVAILAGYHPNTGKYRDGLRSLKGRGMISDDHEVLADNPFAVDAALTANDIKERMLKVMYEEPERRTFEALYEAGANGHTIEELSIAANYHVNTGKFRDAIRKMKNLNMIKEKNKRMALEDWVYGQ